MNADASKSARRPPREREKFLGIHFKCCNVYQRIYKNNNQTAYEGRCPSCGMKVRVPIGSGGTSERFFTAE
jgi:hypothetical protein